MNKGVVFENCTNSSMTNVQVRNLDVGIEVIGGAGNSISGVRAANCGVALKAVNSRGLTVQDIQASVSPDLRAAVATDIRRGADLDQIRARYGDRLKGAGVDLDAWLSRLGNASAVLSLLVQCFGQG